MTPLRHRNCIFFFVFPLFLFPFPSPQVADGTVAQAAGHGHELLQQAGPDWDMRTGTHVRFMNASI